MSDLSRDERVRAKAYDIWVAEGMAEGCDVDHWLRAEALVMLEDEQDQAFVTDSGPVSRVDRAESFGQHAEAAADLRPGQAPIDQTGMHKQGIGG